MEKRNEVIVLLINCLLYKVRQNVRIITLDWNADFSWLKLHCYTDSQPNDRDFELFGDVIALYISYGDNYKVDFDLSVQFYDQDFDHVDTKRFILYGRYEE